MVASPAITLGGNGTVGKELFLYIRDKRSNLNICQKSIGTKKALCSDVPPIETPDPEANAAFSLCQQIPVTPNNGVTNLDQKGQECCLCATGNSGRDSKTGLCTTSSTDPTFVPGIWTAIGCIKADQESIVTTLLRVGIGLAGGVALIMILVAAFALRTSQGEPKRANEAREMLTSAIIGLLFIIFSVTILQFIGVTILRIPNFGP